MAVEGQKHGARWRSEDRVPTVGSGRVAERGVALRDSLRLTHFPLPYALPKTSALYRRPGQPCRSWARLGQGMLGRAYRCWAGRCGEPIVAQATGHLSGLVSAAAINASEPAAKKPPVIGPAAATQAPSVALSPKTKAAKNSNADMTIEATRNVFPDITTSIVFGLGSAIPASIRLLIWFAIRGFECHARKCPAVLARAILRECRHTRNLGRARRFAFALPYTRTFPALLRVRVRGKPGKGRA